MEATNARNPENTGSPTDRSGPDGPFPPGVKRLPRLCLLLAFLSATLMAREPYTEGKIREVEAWLPDKPGVTHHPVSDRPFWEGVRNSLGDGVITEAEKYLKSSTPAWSDEAYRTFFVTGSRKEGEAMLRPGWDRLQKFAAAECLEGKGRFLKAIEAQLLDFANQPSWVLPAHDRNHEIIDGKARYLELRSANVGFDIALTLEWFGNRIDPQVRDRITASLKEKVIEPVFAVLERNDPLITKRHDWRMKPMNWNAVCTVGATGAVLSFEPSKRRRALAVLDAVANTRDYLSGFTRDGYCSEGPGYWGYGFGHFVALADLLQRESGGSIKLGQFPNAAAAATYPDRITLDGARFPAFADAGTTGGPDGMIRWWANLVVGGKREPYPKSGPHANMNGSLAQWLLVGQTVSATSSTPPSPVALGIRNEFPDGGVLVSRSLTDGKVTFSAAMKAGHNAEDHNHNDVGSYVIDWKGSLPVLDPGSSVYTAKTFSRERYDHPILSSYGHSVPIINGQLQSTGREAAGRITTRDFKPDADVWGIDLSACYPKAGVKSLDRRWIFRRGETPSLQILDTVTLNEPGTFETAVVGASTWAQVADKVWLAREGASILRITVDTTQPADFRLEKILNPGRFEPVRLGIRLRDKIRDAAVRVTCEPATEEEWKEAKSVSNLPQISKSPLKTD